LIFQEFLHDYLSLLFVHCLVLKVGDEQEVPLLVYHPTNLRQSAKRAGKSSLFQSKSSFKPVFKGVANAMARLEGGGDYQSRGSSTFR
jgi:hypothetical protein